MEIAVLWWLIVNMPVIPPPKESFVLILEIGPRKKKIIYKKEISK